MKDIYVVTVEENKKYKYVKIVETLFNMTEEEIEKFIIENEIGISDVKTYFSRYLANTQEIELLEKVQRIYEITMKIYDEKSRESKEKQKNDDYQVATTIFDKIVNEGFFDISEFRMKYHKEYNLTKEQFKTLTDKCVRILKNLYPEKYQYYKGRIEENKKIMFVNYKKQIEEMLKGIPNNYDIIDYYLNINMSITVFKRLCSDFLDRESKVKLSMFFNKYNIEKYPFLQIIGCETIVNGEKLSEELKIKILELMKKHNIPDNYFFICYRKYRKGELDNYFEEKRK